MKKIFVAAIATLTLLSCTEKTTTAPPDIKETPKETNPYKLFNKKAIYTTRFGVMVGQHIVNTTLYGQTNEVNKSPYFHNRLIKSVAPDTLQRFFYGWTGAASLPRSGADWWSNSLLMFYGKDSVSFIIDQPYEVPDKVDYKLQTIVLKGTYTVGGGNEIITIKGDMKILKDTNNVILWEKPENAERTVLFEFNKEID